MSTVQSPVSDMLVTVKSREVQRGMFAQMRGERVGAERHLLAAAHLELVLGDDYASAGLEELALRSRLSAASCLWRAGQPAQARTMLEGLMQANPNQAPMIQQSLTDLEINSDSCTS